MFTDGQHNQPPWFTGNFQMQNSVGGTFPTEKSRNHSPPSG
jgi:hypothetical protein